MGHQENKLLSDNYLCRNQEIMITLGSVYTMDCRHYLKERGFFKTTFKRSEKSNKTF